MPGSAGTALSWAVLVAPPRGGERRMMKICVLDISSNNCIYTLRSVPLETQTSHKIPVIRLKSKKR